MKLSVKIFLGICIPSIISSLIISIFLINQNLDSSIENEIQLSIDDVEEIELRLNYTTYSERLFKLNEENYQNKDVKIYYYRDDKIKYKTDDSLLKYANESTDIQEGKYVAIQKNIENKHYIFLSSKVNENENTLVYVKNIDEIYNQKNDLIKKCIFIYIVMIVIIAIIAYIIAKTLVMPLKKIQKEMIKLSKGDYKINLKDSNNEFGQLSKNFNKMSKEIEKRNNELEEYANSKQVFIDNLSHEMNTPLTSIQGYAELMQKANLSEEQKFKYLSYIESETKRISDMYKKLLLLSYKKNADLDMKDVNINYVFNEVQETLNNKLEEKNIQLIINNEIETVFGDETLVIMCITNLVKNAINVSNINSKIIIDGQYKEKEKIISVTDYGCGISKDNIDKILEPFYRVDKVRSRQNGGAGLGLSICKSIMELHGGSINIESELGKGSTFSIKFVK